MLIKHGYSILSLSLSSLLLIYSFSPAAWSQRQFSESVGTHDQLLLAESILKRSFQYYQQLDGFSMRLLSDLSINTAGVVTHKIANASLQFERSKDFSLKMHYPKNSGQIVLEGSKAVFYSPKWNAYANRAGLDLDKTLKSSDFAFITNGAFGDCLISELTSDEPYNAFMKDRTIKSYDGLEKIRGLTCHHISLLRKGADCVQQIWIAAGRKPWIVLFKPTSDCPLVLLPKQDGAPQRTVTFSARFESPKDSSRLHSLSYTPPRRAVKVEQLVGSGQEDARQCLVGRLAPEIKVRTISGGIFKLSRQRGKITILDFWASWCGPCCRALPIVEQVARQYADRGVQLVTINEKENLSDIKTFLAKSSLDLNVCLDSDGEIGSRYRVVGIPQKVIIGRDGKVMFIDVGVGPNLKDRLSQQLQSLLQPPVKQIAP